VARPWEGQSREGRGVKIYSTCILQTRNESSNVLRNSSGAVLGPSFKGRGGSFGERLMRGGGLKVCGGNVHMGKRLEHNCSVERLWEV